MRHIAVYYRPNLVLQTNVFQSDNSDLHTPAVAASVRLNGGTVMVQYRSVQQHLVSAPLHLHSLLTPSLPPHGSRLSSARSVLTVSPNCCSRGCIDQQLLASRVACTRDTLVFNSRTLLLLLLLAAAAASTSAAAAMHTRRLIMQLCGVQAVSKRLHLGEQDKVYDMRLCA